MASRRSRAGKIVRAQAHEGSSPSPGTKGDVNFGIQRVSYILEQMQRKKILIIVGPTSSGKSALAVSLARKYQGEVISADSRQVYRGLDIGTGKITKREMRGIPHHLLDIASPKRIFTAHDFITHSKCAVAQIKCRGKLPIVAGGTGFYIDALVGRIALPNVPVNRTLRSRLEKKTARQLFSMLKKRDPRRAKTIDSHNKRRLVRALEIASALDRVPSHNTEDHSAKDGPCNDLLWVGISPPMSELDKNISMRLSARLRQGFGGQARLGRAKNGQSRGMVAEARRLHARGLSYKRMESLGLEYRWLARLLQKKISRSEFEDMLARDIRRYAKRQITYWKRNKEIKWFNPRNINKISALVSSWLKK